MPIQIGQKIHHDRYRIEKLLGQGGMGAVYLAWDTNLEIPVAIKENLDASAEAQKQFTREAQMLARLAHPNLPRVIDNFILPEIGQYLVMDYVEGEDLQSMLERLGRLPEPQVLAWISQICEALAYLHNQSSPIIHRDIKPGNIKIRPDGRAMLVDFGIAKVYEPSLVTTLGARAFTPGYSPPEQYGTGSTDRRSDIYALGATIYHLLTGKAPPDSIKRMLNRDNMSPPRQLNNEISQTIERIILRSTELDTDRRYQSAEELLAATGSRAGCERKNQSRVPIRDCHAPA
jgi:serine/threonine protein kinase